MNRVLFFTLNPATKQENYAVPRITPIQQFERHLKCRQIYVSNCNIYAELDLTVQRSLYDFYLPHRPVSQKELLAHQSGLRAIDPAIANKVGKYYQQILAADRAHSERSDSPIDAHSLVRTGKWHVVVKPLLRPEPDFKLLAKALLKIAVEEAWKASEPQD